MILCCGEALIDMLPEVTKTGASGFVPHTGGAVFNTAIAIGRLGMPVGLLSGVSTDLFGEQLVAELHASHVDVSALIRTPRPTTLAFVQLVNGVATYTFYDENSAGRSIGTDDILPLSDTISALFFGGISLCAEPAAATYEALAARESGQRVIILDPNVRPSFIQDELQYRNRLARMCALADIIKVSDEDLDWLVPGEGSLREKAGRLLAGATRIVIVTLGREGARAFLENDVEVSVAGLDVKVADTVGAGDTFNAGFLTTLSQLGMLTKNRLGEISPKGVETALEHGTKVASITVSRVGANPPWATEIRSTV